MRLKPPGWLAYMKVKDTFSKPYTVRKVQKERSLMNVNQQDFHHYHRFNDERHPIVHDTGSVEGARPGMVKQALKFRDSIEDDEHRSRFCEEHGAYIGFRGALRFKCSLCNPRGEL